MHKKWDTFHDVSSFVNKKFHIFMDSKDLLPQKLTTIIIYPETAASRPIWKHATV
jgi:hypothetical protein